MKNIIDILTENGIDVAEENKTAIETAVRENYKTIAEFDKKIDKLTSENSTSKETIADLTKQVQELSGNTEEVEKLKATISDYQAKEEIRIRQAEQEKQVKELKERFKLALGEKELKENKYIQDGLFTDFTNALNEDANKGKGDSEIFEIITKDQDVFKNPNERVVIAGAGHSTKPNENDAYIEQYYKGNPFIKK